MYLDKRKGGKDSKTYVLPQNMLDICPEIMLISLSKWYKSLFNTLSHEQRYSYNFGCQAE